MNEINLINTPEEKYLRTVCTEVTEFDDPLKEQVSALMITANTHRANCAGLSMNQIWRKEGPIPRTFIIQVRYGWAIYINPEILQTWKKTVKDFEGCLSLPGVASKKERTRHIRVRYIDRNFQPVEEDMYDFSARVFQHELDHLNGKLFIDG